MTGTACLLAIPSKKTSTVPLVEDEPTPSDV